MIRKISAVLFTITAATVLMLMPKPKSDRVYAQFVTPVLGFSNLSANAVSNAAIGSAGAVTNPASNFLVLVQGGPIYFNGSEQMIGQSTLQLAASTTYQIEWNGPAEQLYAKVAVTGPGSPVGTSSVGNPATILAPITNVEVPIATVVCNATACGNGGNGSITDNRPVSSFPGAGTPLNTTTFANLPVTNVTDGTLILCSSCTQPAAGATCTSGAAAVLALRTGGTWRCL